MIYQACGLDKKIDKRKLVDFLASMSRIDILTRNMKSGLISSRKASPFFFPLENIVVLMRTQSVLPKLLVFSLGALPSSAPGGGRAPSPRRLRRRERSLHLRQRKRHTFRCAFFAHGDGEIYELLRARRCGAKIKSLLCARYSEFASKLAEFRINAASRTKNGIA
jgi:hypothetical protein